MKEESVLYFRLLSSLQAVPVRAAFFMLSLFFPAQLFGLFRVLSLFPLRYSVGVRPVF